MSIGMVELELLIEIGWLSGYSRVLKSPDMGIAHFETAHKYYNNLAPKVGLVRAC